MNMGTKVALVLEMLSDGKWHDLEKLAEDAELARCEMKEIGEFLCEFGLAVSNDVMSKLKVERVFQRFLVADVI